MCGYSVDRQRTKFIKFIISVVNTLFVFGFLMNLGTMSCSSDSALRAREKCLEYLCGKLSQIVQLTEGQKNELRIYDLKKKREIVWMENFVGIQPFFIPKGKKFLYF